MLPFWFFKVWFVTFLNANEIYFEFYENSVKLSSVTLLKKPSLYFSLYQLFFEHLSGEFMSVIIEINVENLQ